jgi:uncharacterized protein (TIGR03435 family)
MKHLSAGASCIFMAALLAGAQQPTFEVASVKRTDQCALQNTIDPAMIALHGDPLRVILMTAFAVKMDQIIGPPWLDSDCVSIDAKIPDGASKDQLPAMLQALLSERLKLAAHKESKFRAGYALVVDKSGPKFKEADPNSAFAREHPGQVAFGFGATGAIRGPMTMASLARHLSNDLGAPVEDLTGLQGKYDIDVSWARDWSVEKRGQFEQDASADTAASIATDPREGDIFTAFRESLGLRLESRKVRTEVVVIDHIERFPTAN